MLTTNNREAGKALRVESQSDSATIYLYGVIDEYYGVSAEVFSRELEALKGKRVTLRINSPGGDVFDGRAMYSAVRQHGNVSAQIDGLSASAASFVALAAKSVSMIEGGFMMIHNAWTFAFGNKNDFIELADLLDKFDHAIINDYIKKTGKTRDEIAAMMDAETWMNTEDALSMKFIDTVFDGDESAENVQANDAWDLSAFDNAPKALTDSRKNVAELAWQQKRAQAERRLRLLNASMN